MLLSEFTSSLKHLHSPIEKGWTLTTGLQTESPLAADSSLGI